MRVCMVVASSIGIILRACGGTVLLLPGRGREGKGDKSSRGDVSRNVSMSPVMEIGRWIGGNTGQYGVARYAELYDIVAPNAIPPLRPGSCVDELLHSTASNVIN